MKLNISVVSGAGKALADHCVDYAVGAIDPNMAQVVEHVSQAIESQVCVNTSIAARTFMLDKELREESRKLFSASDEKVASLLFTVTNGKSYGDFLEISHKTKLMNKDIGPEMDFATGAGLRVDMPLAELAEAVPNLGKFTKFLAGLEYRGEIVLLLDEQMRIVTPLFGHFPTFFAMYSELARNGCQSVLEYCAGQLSSCSLMPQLVIGHVVSMHPFPLTLVETDRLRVPQSAEKHVWRFPVGKTEPVMLTVYGNTLTEAKRRLFRTIEYMLQYTPTMQYRTDVGLRLQFLLCNETWQKLVDGGQVQGSKPMPVLQPA